MGVKNAAADLVATSPELLAPAAAIVDAWDELGVTGAFLGRNIDSGEQFGFNIKVPFPLASVAKVSLALGVLDAADQGVIDRATRLTIDPAEGSLGPAGIPTFRFPVTLAVADLVNQMLAVSDNAAADALLDLLGISTLNDKLNAWGVTGLTHRHRFQRMFDCAAGVAGHDFGLAMELAIRGDQPGEVHAIETMDTAYGNIGSAEALVTLLQRIWSDDVAAPETTAEIRRLMGHQQFSHRLSSDLRADAFTVSAKTGTFLNLRHEIGVVETESGDRIAIAALTRSSQKARTQQEVDLSIGTAARLAVDTLRVRPVESV
jgi:beta-lactamase class A